MIQIVRMTAVGAAAVLVGTASAGCASSSANGSKALPSCLVPKEPVALAIGARSNSPMPSLTAGITAVMNTAVNAHQTISVVRLDGNPRVVFSQPFIPQGNNSQTRKTEYNTYVTKLNEILQGTQQTSTDIRAQIPQANVLDTLAEASSEVPRGGNVIVMDSGLQTTEPLDFSTGLLSDDPQTIVDYLKHAGELPDLAGRHVYFFGLGWTASPQPALGISNRNKVIQIWAKIASAAGASCVAFDPTANTQDAVPNRPQVTIVTPPPPPSPPVACSVTNLNDANNVGFEFDSTTFRDPAGARVTLRKLADVILRTDEAVTLTGSTSSEGSNQYNLALSLRRAEAVKAVLVQLAVPSSRITTFGDGSHLPGRLNDQGPSGQLLIGPAIQDRKVVAKLTGPKCRSA
jgi:OmpA-OmpF porin, OOP family